MGKPCMRGAVWRKRSPYPWGLGQTRAFWAKKEPKEARQGQWRAKEPPRPVFGGSFAVFHAESPNIRQEKGLQAKAGILKPRRAFCPKDGGSCVCAAVGRTAPDLCLFLIRNCNVVILRTIPGGFVCRFFTFHFSTIRIVENCGKQFLLCGTIPQLFLRFFNEF